MKKRGPSRKVKKKTKLENNDKNWLRELKTYKRHMIGFKNVSQVLY